MDYQVEVSASTFISDTDTYQAQIALSELLFDVSEDIAIEVKYKLSASPFARMTTISLDRTSLRGDSLFLNLAEVVDRGMLAKVFEDNGNEFTFALRLEIFMDYDLNHLREQGLIEVQQEEREDFRTITVTNRIIDPQYQISLNDYVQIVGDLSVDLIHDISVFGIQDGSYRLSVSESSRQLSVSDYKTLVHNALSSQRGPYISRLSQYLRAKFNLAMFSPIDISIVIEQLQPQQTVRIIATLRDLERELFFETGNNAIDKIVRDIHQDLVRREVPVGPGNETYQKVLNHLLRYKQGCTLVTDYIDDSIASKGEIAGFHGHIHSKLHDYIEIGVLDIHSETDIGNSRADLLLDGLPAELKCEDRRTATSREIVDRYKSQAADYVSRRNSPIGFLVILDTVLDRQLPTSPLEHDVFLEEVTTVSGRPVMVIAIIVRIPRRASELTKEAKKKKR